MLTRAQSTRSRLAWCIEFQLRVLAQRFEVSPDALHRHRHKHLTPTMAAAILAAQQPSVVDLKALQRNEAEGLLSQLVVQRARLQQQSDLALELGNASGAIAAERAITSNLELVAKLLGTLMQRHEVTRTSILISARATSNCGKPSWRRSDRFQRPHEQSARHCMALRQTRHGTLPSTGGRSCCKPRPSNDGPHHVCSPRIGLAFVPSGRFASLSAYTDGPRHDGSRSSPRSRSCTDCD